MSNFEFLLIVHIVCQTRVHCVHLMTFYCIQYCSKLACFKLVTIYMNSIIPYCVL